MKKYMLLALLLKISGEAIAGEQDPVEKFFSSRYLDPRSLSATENRIAPHKQPRILGWTISELVSKLNAWSEALMAFRDDIKAGNHTVEALDKKHGAAYQDLIRANFYKVCSVAKHQITTQKITSGELVHKLQEFDVMRDDVTWLFFRTVPSATELALYASRLCK